ncbi:hypothetical protein [Stetteria hydrogenophila]
MAGELDGIPEDVLEELKEAMEEIEREVGGGRRPRRRYPSARDIAEAVREVALAARGSDPQEFPDLVREHLEEKGFYVGLVTDKRIWRVYETLVRRGVIPDTLGVVEW